MSLFGLFKRYAKPKLNFLIYKEDCNWVAHCLEFDMMAYSPDTPETAINELVDLIKFQMLYSIYNGNIDNMLVPAPDSFWAKRLYAKKISHRKLNELKNININNNKINNYLPFKKAELCYI